MWVNKGMPSQTTQLQAKKLIFYTKIYGLYIKYIILTYVLRVIYCDIQTHSQVTAVLTGDRRTAVARQ